MNLGSGLQTILLKAHQFRGNLKRFILLKRSFSIVLDFNLISDAFLFYNLTDIGILKSIRGICSC